MIPRIFWRAITILRGMVTEAAAPTSILQWTSAALAEFKYQELDETTRTLAVFNSTVVIILYNY